MLVALCLSYQLQKSSTNPVGVSMSPSWENNFHCSNNSHRPFLLLVAVPKANTESTYRGPHLGIRIQESRPFGLLNYRLSLSDLGGYDNCWEKMGFPMRMLKSCIGAVQNEE